MQVVVRTGCAMRGRETRAQLAGRRAHSAGCKIVGYFHRCAKLSYRVLRFYGNCPWSVVGGPLFVGAPAMGCTWTRAAAAQCGVAASIELSRAGPAHKRGNAKSSGIREGAQNSPTGF